MDKLIFDKIQIIRNQKIMLDFDLANLYGVTTKALKQQVRRNIERFPADFMFELSDNEFDNLRSQIVTSNNKGGVRYNPMAFTEQGVAMLSSVLRSPTAIKVNVQIMRVFVQMRSLSIEAENIKLDILKIKERIKDQELQMNKVFEYLDQLIRKKKSLKYRKRIGYKFKNDEL